MFEGAQVIQRVPPVIAGKSGAVQQGVDGGIVEPGGAREAGAPLGAEAQEQADDGPVFGPDFDGVEGVVVWLVAGALQLCSGGQPVIDSLGRLDQFPRRPSMVAAR